MFKIMIVEDDETIRESVSDSLLKWDFDCFSTTNFANTLTDFIEEKPHLVLLDINLPVFDGFYWCQKIREISNVPILFISSRSTNMDMVMVMNMGGDDFINKPFSIEVLIAKINAVLRRTYNYADQTTDAIQHNNVILNLQDGSATVNDTHIDLSKNEYKLLHLLMKNHGKIISREKLLRGLWDDERYVDDNTLTVNINRLRKKIDQAGAVGYIETKICQGYIIP
ncbi:DNA-binding response regulator [Carnobacterium maltaromaticum]|uniref:response regulator transcription factor n=1 Tax=Carnobacterium maltaromaticum TaxID=2751 RepID=UPI000C78AFBE|nr:response regulator transcription factor [Carnobacterium maltaromaticum]PLS33830.1 DNA-binding response regulator [Carnobacterium maltaromaticum]PLS35811.1 DNA-binding response regulator [Carnobacterium maltaromaticum]PLS36261.1 DNA-binding response regulator [Carnobacterium maltaromaticum]PLS42718.1 DNA-binding response regulator [Carnobacterium maltaromaticum]PLS42954.1 DNA-binding response regulator [Carnobacterium maltaromaticum]